MKKVLALLFIILLNPAWLLAAVNSVQDDKQAIYTKNAPAPIGPFSQAIKIDDTVYLSGQLPTDPKTGELVTGDFTKQVKQVLLNLSEVAKAGGGTLDDIVKVTVYVTDLSNFAVVNKVMSEYFHKPYPARVTIEVKGLPKQATVEIEAIMKISKGN
jgi:2-iminobutanoate/2-iminopropanoate deaminase